MGLYQNEKLFVQVTLGKETFDSQKKQTQLN